jgi:outer membrane protein
LNVPSRKFFLAGLSALALALSVSHVGAETLQGALAKAYENNSVLNYDRAGLRATHEEVPLAKSGMRPRIIGTGEARVTADDVGEIRAGSFGINLEQPIFDGFQTRNRTRAAEAGVRAAQASLRNNELNLLLDATAAYMDVIRARQIAALLAQNIEFLREQLRSSRSRFEVGEGTRTDVAQAEASLQVSLADLASARAAAASAEALYRQIVGEDPGSLQMPEPLRSLMPGAIHSAYSIAFAEHPAIEAREHLVDQASFGVKAREGELLPSLSATAGVRVEAGNGYRGSTDGQTASIGLSLRVPIYQGGQASAQVRQSKESLGQARIAVDVTRDEIRAAVASAWGQYEAAVETARASREALSAARLALSGVIEERDVGQRTTLDVLRGQEDVINAQITLLNAQREVVVTSYAIASATGRLSAERLGLPVTLHRPQEHYEAVKDKWIGLRTPDGR